jgi:hypothetical protein
MHQSGRMFDWDRLGRCLIMLCALAALAFAGPAEARRVALVIGNAAYAHASLLPNTTKDANLIARAAKQAGFEVTEISDLGKAGFDQALRDFRIKADGAEVAMIYYAGHGMESAGRNWVIPIDATLAESRDLRFEAIELDGLLETVSGSRLRIIVLDACRNNPFGTSWRSAVRAVPKGLVETEFEGTGALVMFAAAGGQVASDGLGENSPFARALAERIPEPGLSIHRLGSVVREEVIKETGGGQAPWVTMSLDGQEFFLVPPANANPPAAAGNGGGSGGQLADAYAWRYANEKNTIGAFEEYLRNFPGGVFSTDAADRLAQLRTAPTVGKAEPRPQPAKPAIVALTPAQVDPPKSAISQAPAPQSPAPLKPGEAQSLAQVTTAANYVTDRAALPALPETPVFSASSYPGCRDAYATMPDAISKVVKINDCLAQLTQYVSDVMNGYSVKMIQHQDELNRLYKGKVAGNNQYSPESQQAFYDAAMKEHRESNPDGEHFAEYRTTKERYEQDRKFLQEQYCAFAQVCAN